MIEAPNASLMISVGNDISITTTERNLTISSDSTAAPRKMVLVLYANKKLIGMKQLRNMKDSVRILSVKPNIERSLKETRIQMLGEMQG